MGLDNVEIMISFVRILEEAALEQELQMDRSGVRGGRCFRLDQ